MQVKPYLHLGMSPNKSDVANIHQQRSLAESEVFTQEHKKSMANMEYV